MTALIENSKFFEIISLMEVIQIYKTYPYLVTNCKTTHYLGIMILQHQIKDSKYYSNIIFVATGHNNIFIKKLVVLSQELLFVKKRPTSNAWEILISFSSPMAKFVSYIRNTHGKRLSEFCRHKFGDCRIS